MNKFWFFGDSTTNHFGLTKGYEWYDKYTGKKQYFTKILSNKYNLQCKNMGIDGASNHIILNCIIRNLKNIKKGDRVLMQTTGPFRFEIYKNNKIQVGHANNLEKQKEDFTKEELKVLHEYSKYFLIDNERNMDMFTFSSYFGLYSYFASNGILPTILHHSIFYNHLQINFKMPNITDESNGEVDDFHIGYQAQSVLANIIDDELKSNNNIIIPYKNKNLRNSDLINEIIKKDLI